MIKVLYLINHAGKAGTERYVHSLMKYLHGTEIEAYFMYNEEGLLCQWVKDLSIPVESLVMNSPLDIRAADLLKDFCFKNDIQIIHTQFLREDVIAMLAKFAHKNVKVFYTNHFIMEKRKSIKMAFKLLNKLQDQVIAVCNKGREMMMENGIPEKKIALIHNGVDLNEWGTPIESTLRKEFDIGDDEFVFICGSRFAHDKGHQFLIKSVARLKQLTNKKFRCILANDGPLWAECKELAKSLNLTNDIIFTGYRPDIKNLIYGADLYVNSSEHEALSFAIIEVLACGIPVIATNMAGNGDIINDETKCGILVEYNNENMLAEEIKKIMEDEELVKRLKFNAKKAAQEKFDLQIMVEKTLQLYKKHVY